MASIRIFPRFKLVLTYDIRPEALSTYQRFVINDFIPTAQELSLYMLAVWQTVYGPYPARQVEFVAESRDLVDAALKNEQWRLVETELRSFVGNYNRRVISFREGFQLVGRPSR